MPNLSIRWRSRPDIAPPEHEIDALKTVVIQLRRELTDKTGYAATLELVLHQRLETIDALRGRIEQLQERNQQLGAEADRLAEMVRCS
jgi:hypothetical protein